MDNQPLKILEHYGWNSVFQDSFTPLAEKGWIPGRIIAHARGKLLTVTEAGELWCSIPGSFGRSMEAEGITYCTGDWIAIEPYQDNTGGLIRKILPRMTALKRLSTGGGSRSQLLAANIDTVFIVMGLDKNFNPARAERMAVLAWDSGAQPVVILNKADLVDDPKAYTERIEASSPGVPVFPVSAVTGLGTEDLRGILSPGKTGVFMGSSGVGKSTLLNTLAGAALRKTQAVREADGRGRHTTSLRELFLIPGLGCIIDSPGIREVGLSVDEEGLNSAFSDVVDEIEALAASCRFSDCTHQGEPGCAVSAALADGVLSQERYQSYLKLKREVEFAASREDDRLKREREKKWKDIAKYSRELKKREGT
ncbi:MAG: ribosome small subunit-dependent GTPase A [Spirochaetales bacterium]|nr:ribosome small subunit-dependent GTPase A [Spirochaetales bacterium]